MPKLKAFDFQVAAHGCNCFCAFGKGIALSIKNAFPEAYKADCATTKGDRGKLGSIVPVQVGPESWIINAYTQYDYWSQGPRADYDAIRNAMLSIRDFMLEHGYDTLTIPKIGAGLAGGDWNRIEGIIKECFGDTDITVDVYYL